ncbi:CsbD family protein [Synechococcus sp. PCC 6312]|uniref:CsbD family protein n=1 Tax=Synechococcus sp. (strain ATCC 27167 / PCC 6312) TaxID=195253 RepID=UPI00029EE1D9|nr:hypothetical protein Syn6312_0076 [Synechococcus sp. PCC 6312]
MISPQQFRRFLITILLTAMFMLTLGFDFGKTNTWAWAVMSDSSLNNQPLLANINRSKATAKNLEGKIQEAAGNLSGNPQDQLMGKAKQAESQARNIVENVKDQIKSSGRTQAFGKNIEGHLQEARGNITGNPSDQIAGRAKQVESQARNMVENVKDSVKKAVK